MKLYRDCNGAVGPANVVIRSDAPGLSAGINCSLVSQTDVSPVCNQNGPAITCSGAAGSNPPVAGAVEEFIYVSAPVVLTGVPSSAGWTFWYTNCCRNAAILNITPNQDSFTLRAKMFSYNGQNANPCYDNSPSFYEPAQAVVCTGFPFVFNHNARDPELDSLVYEWEHPLSSNVSTTQFNPTVMNFVTTYGFDHPLPGLAQDSNNVPTVLDPHSGEISITSHTGGTYVLVLKVSEYRCHVKIAEIYRDMQVVFSTCPFIYSTNPNYQPLVSAPFIYGGNPSFTDTVNAGDTVSFILSAADFDLDSLFNPQTLHYKVSGMELDSTYSTSSGNCPFPPCATVYPSPVGFSAVTDTAISFYWVTPGCISTWENLCSVNTGAYFFNFTFYDDFCPIPAQTYHVIKIVVVGDSVAAIFQSHDTLYSSINATSFQWYQNGIAITGATNNFFVPVQGATYYVQAIFPSGCSTQSQPIIFIPSGMNLQNENSTIQIKPNPFRNIVQFHIFSDKERKGVLSIKDVAGRELFSKNYTFINNEITDELDLSAYNAGIYFLDFNRSSGVKTVKLVKYE